jgi:hypothetical protein
MQGAMRHFLLLLLLLLLLAGQDGLLALVEASQHSSMCQGVPSSCGNSSSSSSRTVLVAGRGAEAGEAAYAHKDRKYRTLNAARVCSQLQ